MIILFFNAQPPFYILVRSIYPAIYQDCAIILIIAL
jgi:hypothetical protein